MNAPSPDPTPAERQALSAPFLIEDGELVRAIARLADERGTPMQEIVAQAVEAYMHLHRSVAGAPAWLQTFWNDHPLPLPTGLKADKRFFDSLYDPE